MRDHTRTTPRPPQVARRRTTITHVRYVKRESADGSYRGQTKTTSRLSRSTTESSRSRCFSNDLLCLHRSPFQLHVSSPLSARPKPLERRRKSQQRKGLERPHPPNFQGQARTHRRETNCCQKIREPDSVSNILTNRHTASPCQPKCTTFPHTQRHTHT